MNVITKCSAIQLHFTGLISWYAAIRNRKKKVTAIASFKLAHTSGCYVKADRKMLSSNDKSTMDFPTITTYESKKLTQ